jgi:hypothetical protein
MGSESAPIGFWYVVGRAVDNAGFLTGIKRHNGESDEAWRNRLKNPGDNVRLNPEDLDALTRQYNGKTIIDLIEQCKSSWPDPTAPSPQASYRT